MGIHIADDAVALDLVPSRDGVVVSREEGVREFFIGTARLVTIIVVLLFCGVALVFARQRLRAARRMR
jgi:hypothetical protein